MLLTAVAISLLFVTPGQEPSAVRTAHWNRCVNFRLPDDTDTGNESPEEAFASCSWLLQNGAPTPSEKAFIYTNRAGMFIVKKDYNAARIDATSAIQIDDFDNDRDYRALAHFTRARALYFLQRHRDALADVDAALAASPKGRYYAARAQLKELLGDIDGALTDWSTVKLLEPARLSARYCELLIERGRASLAKNANRPALIDFELATSCPATKNQALLWHARTSRIDSDSSKAIEDLDKILASDPRFPGAHLERGIALEEFDKPDEAMKAYSAAIALNPRDAGALGRRASLSGRSRQYDRAFQDAEAALAIEPKNADALLGRGIAHLAKRQPDQAARDLSGALSGGVAEQVARAYRGLAYVQLKDLGKAVEDFEAALKRESPWQAYFGRSVVREQRGDASGAGRDLATARMQTGYSADEIAAFGFALSHLEMWPACEESWTRWESGPHPCTPLIESGSLGLKDLARALYFRGRSYYPKQPALALEDLSRAIATAPSLGDAYYRRGQVHYGEKRFDLAVADWSRAVEMGAEVKDALYGRSKAYLHLKQPKLAVADLELLVTKFKADYAIALRSIARQMLGDWNGADEDFLTASAKSPQLAVAYWEWETGTEPKVPPRTNKGAAKTPAENWLRCGYYRPADVDACSALIASGTESADRQIYIRRIRAEAYGRSQQHALAVDDYTWLLGRDEKSSSYRFDRALAAIKAGDLKLASFDLDILVSQAGDSWAVAYFARGVLREQTGNSQGAASDFAIALKRDPSVADTMAKLGIRRGPGK